MTKKSITTKEKAFEYLNKNKETVLDMELRQITFILMKELNRSYEICRVYFHEWKEEVLGCPHAKKRKRTLYREPFLKKDGDILIGENGEYSLEDGGLLLTKGKAYLKFENKEELIQFFDETLAAYDKLQEMEV
jgi:hypothetical protein